MENEHLTLNEAELIPRDKSQLNTITPLSKYLAVALFIFLPFLGGWIGYTLAPERIVEVQKVVVKEMPTDTSNPNQPQQNVSESETITNDVFGFSFQKPAGWQLEIKTEDNDWQSYILTSTEQLDTSQNIQVSISSNVFEGAATVPAELFDLQTPQDWPLISQRLICEPSDDELPAGFVRTEENLREFCKSNSRLVTIFTDVNVSDNFVWSISAKYEAGNEQIFEEALNALVSSFQSPKTSDL